MANSQVETLRHLGLGDGTNPHGTPVIRNSTIYGTTVYGGNYGFGTIYRLANDGSSYTVLRHFTGADGANPVAGLARRGQTLYGVTAYGGANNAGVIFRLRLDGSGYALLRHLKEPNGANAYSRLHATLVGGVWHLYGTTTNGGRNGTGVIFRSRLNGSNFTVVHHFGPGPLGTRPAGGVIHLGTRIYGVTNSGGAYDGGVIYRMNDSGGGYTVLRHLSVADGYGPVFNSLISNDAWLFGTLQYGGSSGHGTIYRIALTGSGFTVLHHFDGVDGAHPTNELVRAGTKLYGTTSGGGVNDVGTIFAINADGTGFAVLDHCSITDGANPAAGLALNAGILYGAASLGGANGLGTIFKLGP